LLSVNEFQRNRHVSWPRPADGFVLIKRRARLTAEPSTVEVSAAITRTKTPRNIFISVPAPGGIKFTE